MRTDKEGKVDKIENLSASVIVDQSRLGGNSRSTVGTISDMYAALRLLFSRIGEPYAGTASYFSFNDPNGMCPECSGIGKVMSVDYESRLDPEKSWNEGMADLPAFHIGNWYWKQYAEANIFPLDKKWKDFTETERNHLLYGADTPGGEAQRVKLVRYMGSSLTGMTYIFDEPSTGMHPRDVYRMTNLLKSLRDRGNTVLVVEHDKD